MYQEEVINHLQDSNTLMRKVVEAKDKVINDLYQQVSLQKEELEVIRGGGGSHQLESDMKYGSRSKATFEVTPGAGSADNGYGLWMEEKRKLIQQRNEMQTKMGNEIRFLQKSLDPNVERTYNEIIKADQVRGELEAELVQSHIQNDELRSEISSLRENFKYIEVEKEVEKTLLEDGWKDRYYY